MQRLKDYKLIASGEVIDDPVLGPGRRRWVALKTSEEGHWMLLSEWAYQTWWYVQNYGKRLRGAGAAETAARLAPELSKERFVA